MNEARTALAERARHRHEDADRLHLVIDPGIQFGRPTIPGTRITSECMAERVAAGESVDEVAGDYSRTREEVLLCCWHEYRYMSPSRGKRRDHDLALIKWAEDHTLSFGGWDKHPPLSEVPDPPPKV